MPRMRRGQPLCVRIGGEPGINTCRRPTKRHVAEAILGATRAKCGICDCAAFEQPPVDGCNREVFIFIDGCPPGIDTRRWHTRMQHCALKLRANLTEQNCHMQGICQREHFGNIRSSHFTNRVPKDKHGHVTSTAPAISVKDVDDGRN